jgi:hypothetical protein
MAHRSIVVEDAFFPGARALRRHFEQRFSNPRAATADRFVWDFWHVPGQYTALRTPAWTFFPKGLYDRFHQRLAWWGRRALGCHDVSPPWLSCYVDGCEQRLHGDLPHGAFAFVYSLTPWAGRAFRGGETLLLREEVLDYWEGFVSARSLEEPELMREVQPRFNRLTVFDGRLPHAVRRVSGVQDPREGRLVVHGWFVQPRPFVEGPLPVEALERAIPALLEAGTTALAPGVAPAGLVSLSFRVTPTGKSTQARLLCDTTRVPAHQEGARRRFVSALLSSVKRLSFPRQRGASRVTLPLVFER